MADVDVKELLGAYLASDIRPEERAAVERLLSEDPETRAVLDSLRDVLGSVQSADCPVTPAMSRQLRERLAPLLADEVTSAALGSALAGELTAPEQEQLKRYLREHPSEKTRMSAMRNTAQWMKKNQPVASDAMSAALRERLAAKIPALRGLETQVSRETTMVKTPPIPKPARAATTSSLRVVAKDDPWKRRFVWGAAAAAAASVALAFGIAKIFETPNTGLAKNGTKTDVAPKQSDPLPEAPRVSVQDQHVVEIPPTPKTNENEIPRPLPLPQNGPVVEKDEPKSQLNPIAPEPQDRITQETPRKKPIVIPQEREADPFTPKVPAPEVTTNKTTPKTIEEPVPINSVPKAPGGDVADRTQTGFRIPVPNDSQKPPRPPSDTVSNVPGTDVTSLDGPKVTTKTTDNTNPPKTAMSETGGISVSSVKNGSVSAQAEGGEQQTLTSAQVGSKLTSGTELITSQTSRIVLDLPDGRLWVNTSSRLRVRMSGSTTTVELGGGQFAFETSKGSLIVKTSGEAVVTAAKNVDVRLENGALIAVVLSERATIKGKKVERGQQATVANPASADQPTVKPADGVATNWRAEDEPDVAPTNDNPAKGKSKSKSRAR